MQVRKLLPVIIYTLHLVWLTDGLASQSETNVAPHVCSVGLAVWQSCRVGGDNFEVVRPLAKIEKVASQASETFLAFLLWYRQFCYRFVLQECRVT